MISRFERQVASAARVRGTGLSGRGVSRNTVIGNIAALTLTANDLTTATNNVVSSVEGNQLRLVATGGTGPYKAWERRGSSSVFLGDHSGNFDIDNGSVDAGEYDSGGDRVFYVTDEGNGSAASADYTVTIPDNGIYLIGDLTERSSPGHITPPSSLHSPSFVIFAFRAISALSVSRTILSCEGPGNVGYRILWTPAGTLQYAWRNSGGTLVPLNKTGISTGTPGPIHVAYMHFGGIGGGSAIVTGAVDKGTLTSSAANGTGYNAGSLFVAGTTAESASATPELEILGLYMGSSAVLDVTAINAHCDAVKAAGHMVAPSGATGLLWTPHCKMAGLSALGSWPDESASVNLSPFYFNSGVSNLRHKPEIRRYTSGITWGF